MDYFDNGATTFPKPDRVEEAIINALSHYGANPGRSGHKMAMRTALKVYACREAAATLFHIDNPENVVFCNNATHAINMAVKGVLCQGDHVIMSDLEHNAVLRPVHKLYQDGKITYDVAVTSPDVDQTVANFAQLIQPNTKLIICTHASNVFGIRLPIEKLGKLAAERGVYFMVDAAQTAGVLDINIPEFNIDFLCTAGHKSLYGPTGTGLLITPHGERLDTIIEGGTGSFSAEFDQPPTMPDRLESGTGNVLGIVGLEAGIRYVIEKTPAKIYDHEMKLGEMIFCTLKQIPGVVLYTNHFGKDIYLPVISFNIKGIHSEETASMLSDLGFALRAGLHCAPLAHRKMGTLENGTVRISIGAFNTPNQALALCDAIKKIARKHCNTVWM